MNQLHQANLFLFPLDARREWYRYRHLFADFPRTESEFCPTWNDQLPHRHKLGTTRGLIYNAVGFAWVTPRPHYLSRRMMNR